MIRNEVLYKFCKKYTEEYEECEKEAENYLQQVYGTENVEDELYENMLNEEIFSKCAMSKAGLQALIVDDFVQQLDEELQMQIIMHCMGIKSNNGDWYADPLEKGIPYREMIAALKLLPERFHEEFIKILESSPQTPRTINKNFAIFFERIVGELTDDERDVIREKNIFLNSRKE